MRFFTGQYDRAIDAKNRIQLPSQLRGAIEEIGGGRGLYVTLGEHRGTLSIFTDQTFEALADRIGTEVMPGPESRRFELQFYALASYVEIDKQGRILLPEKLCRKARLEGDVVLVGQKFRLDLWNRAELEKTMSIDWDGEDWPDWQGFLRMKPEAGQQG